MYANDGLEKRWKTLLEKYAGDNPEIANKKRELMDKVSKAKQHDEGQPNADNVVLVQHASAEVGYVVAKNLTQDTAKYIINLVKSWLDATGSEDTVHGMQLDEYKRYAQRKSIASYFSDIAQNGKL